MSARRFPASLTLMGVRCWKWRCDVDRSLAGSPTGKQSKPDLTLLVSGRELGSIGTEMSWQSEKPLSSRTPGGLIWPSRASCRGTSSTALLETGGRAMIWAMNKHPRGSAAGGWLETGGLDLGLADAVRG